MRHLVCFRRRPEAIVLLRSLQEGLSVPIPEQNRLRVSRLLSWRIRREWLAGWWVSGFETRSFTVLYLKAVFHCKVGSIGSYGDQKTAREIERLLGFKKIGHALVARCNFKSRLRLLSYCALQFLYLLVARKRANFSHISDGKKSPGPFSKYPRVSQRVSQSGILVKIHKLGLSFFLR